MSKNELMELEKNFSALKQNLNDEKMLLEILQVFNIPLDTTRLNDYRITKYELDKNLRHLIIEIIDTKTHTVFEIINSTVSKITGRAFADEGDRFNTVTIKDSNTERNIYYYEGEALPSLEEAKILAEVEDIYRPYKQKKKTRATIAKSKGISLIVTIFLFNYVLMIKMF